MLVRFADWLSSYFSLLVFDCCGTSLAVAAFLFLRCGGFVLRFGAASAAASVFAPRHVCIMFRGICNIHGVCCEPTLHMLAVLSMVDAGGKSRRWGRVLSRADWHIHSTPGSSRPCHQLTSHTSAICLPPLFKPDLSSVISSFFSYPVIYMLSCGLVPLYTEPLRNLVLHSKMVVSCARGVPSFAIADR